MINLIEIIGKHSPLIAAGLAHNKAFTGNPIALKAAINEIVEAVTDKCAEEAEAIEGWNTGFSGCAATVDKYSILAVKNMISYE